MLEKSAETCAENFVEHIRQKIATPKHKFKKTDRINMQVRFPEYREETESEKQEAAKNKIDLAAVVKKVVKKGYDQEFMERLRRFFEFVKRIFKKDSPTS